MNKTILKKFAIESRQDLMKRMENKIKSFYVDEEFAEQQNGDIYILANDKHSLNLSKEEYNKRELLIKRINELGLKQVIEEAAYTWFNRIVAIRYMEIHDYLPLTRDNQSLGVRVLSSKDNTPDPEIMKFTNLVNPELDIDFKKEKYVELKDDNEKFKYILLLVCKKLGRVIPQVFDGVTDYIDILVPDNLLNESGFVNKIITEVPKENYEQVEIIGWLYQYYISEKKDEVFDMIKNNKKVSKDNIPAATQLFTPDWIVKYLVQNSLGKFWVEKSGNMNLTERWQFFIKDNLNIVRDNIFSPEQIKIIDPCCGSGHILVYSFDVLYQIYESLGYNQSQIPSIILKNNIYGLDIDERATQLSLLTIILKAREFSKNIFQDDIIKNINIVSMRNTITSINTTFITESKLKEEIEAILKDLKDATDIGSLLLLDKRNLADLRQKLDKDTTIVGYELKKELEPALKVYEILSSQFDIVITNPPYMSKRVYEKKLSNYLEKFYPIGKYDLYTSFIIRNICYFCKDNGYTAMITIHTWMFISMFEELRKNILDNFNIDTMLHTGANTFEELNSFNVLACAFCIKKTNNFHAGIYIKLTDYLTPKDKILNINNINNIFVVNQNEFLSVVGQPFVYWMTDNERNIFKSNRTVRDYGEIKQGMATSDNKRFLRYWTEVNYNKIGFNMSSNEQAYISKKKWFPYNKGGDFRKWYGNNELVVNWDNNGEELKKFTATLPQGTGVRLKSQEYYFKSGITWSLFGFENFGVRYKDNGFIFDISGSSMFFENEENAKILLTFLASKIAFHFLSYLAPTVNFQIKNIGDLPVIQPSSRYKTELLSLADENIEIAKKDWDSSEISWNFKTLLNKSYKSVYEWVEDTLETNQENYFRLKNNEERINQIYIDIYNLNNINKEVIKRDMSIKLLNPLDLVKRLISYSIGCMFGRYSLDDNGLIYAGGEFDENKYKKFKADSDNIIPITDEAYFDDDIVQRFKQFIEIVFGKETLNENLDFIAETLGKKGTETSEETIRRYFVNDFFNDHCKIYQKRPIYWLLDSGKKNGFKALIYMHRYNENLIPKARLDYLHKVQTTYEKLLSDVNYKLTTDLSMVDKKEAQKRQADLNAKLQEIKEYDEKIAHIANQRISIDLDDGVKVNYERFKDILAKIK